MTNNISLYFHIPFCVKKCDYCAFYSLANQSEETKQAYFEALMRQMSFLKTDKVVKTVYFGGGTPTVIGRERLCALVAAVKERFCLDEDCEITVEVNPKTVDKEYLQYLKDCGVNRLSIGVQACDDSLLASIGRIHTYADAVECIKAARKAGFENISADLMFALPKLSVELFEKELEQFLQLNVEHISAYSLQLEEGTPLYARREAVVFPDEEQEEAQYERLWRTLTENGYTHYEVSSFCRAGFESRHNLNYWAVGEYFGFGAAAHSFYGGKRFCCVASVEEYVRRSFGGLYSPTDYDECEPLSEDEIREERIMLGLRTRYGARLDEHAFDTARRIEAMGYGRFEDGVLRLNSKGFRVSNSIIGQVLIYKKNRC